MGETLGRRLWSPKPLPKTLPKGTIFVCVNVAAGHTKKRANPVDTSKLDPAVFSLFFLSVSRTRWLRHRPAAQVCGCARGVTLCDQACPRGTDCACTQHDRHRERALPARRSGVIICIQACPRGTVFACTQLHRHRERALPAGCVLPASKLVHVGRTVLVHNMIGTGSGHCPPFDSKEKRPFSPSYSLFLMILPDTVLGSPSENTMMRGYL